MKNKFRQKGIGIVEGIVGISMLLIIFIAFSSLLNFNQRIQQQNENKLEAINIAAEAIEAVYSIKKEDWDIISALNFSTNYYPEISGKKWVLSATDPGPVGGIYQRWVVLERVYRDLNDDIAAAGAEDTESRKVTAYVEWNERGSTKQITLVTYITNWIN